MSDLISRQAAIDAINEYMERLRIHIATPNDTESYSYARGLLVGVINDIEQLPSAQPEQPEIVRCKDCKHWIPYDWMFSEVWQSKNIADYPEDEIGCNYCDMAMKANDFCSRGERRTDG